MPMASKTIFYFESNKLRIYAVGSTEAWMLFFEGLRNEFSQYFKKWVTSSRVYSSGMLLREISQVKLLTFIFCFYELALSHQLVNNVPIRTGSHQKFIDRILSHRMHGGDA